MPRKHLTVADVPGLLEASKAELGPQSDEKERPWIDRYGFLKSKGYTLDERYAPDWVPSWASEPADEYLVRGNKWYRTHEDAFADRGARMYVKDAVRMTDGLQVIVKLALAGTTELEILQYLSTADDPGNSAQRVLDAFPVPEDDPVYNSEGDSELQGQAMYIILPLARDWRHPPFVVAPEGLAFIQQLLVHRLYSIMHPVNLCALGKHLL
ncbi:hypothetical protein EXIGLDRAFT_764570 [Exidia glandulosa HHB12029]|uniref:Uncharacterized protein n=1 Tax=Exidia glandulosa HHB12029 TaxID=1314781 RepID=A0A165L345_EXIGL|nr:hypothetical protein EXIGLDRAFT_764570 [Exidia glandulosa HHB12029]